MEIVWTGLHSLLTGDPKLVGNTSIWMFPIYGMAALFTPICSILKGKNFIIRGGIYAVCIFIAEFTTGALLRSFQLCPWDYSNAKYNIMGLIRLDYAPVWFIAGLIFEKLVDPARNILKEL